MSDLDLAHRAHMHLHLHLYLHLPLHTPVILITTPPPPPKRDDHSIASLVVAILGLVLRIVEYCTRR